MTESNLPVLRETFTMSGAREKWARPCPPWCIGDKHEGHDLDRIASMGTREHGSQVFRVKQDGGYGYYAEEGDGARSVEGVMAAHLAVQVIAGSRSVSGGRIRITLNYGTRDGEHRAIRTAPLFPDEARELIAVLEHLLSVAETEQ